MKFSIIIVNYNSTKYIKRLVKSISIFLNEFEYEIIIVDNKSPDRDIEDFARKNVDIKFIFLEKNYGFGYANNRGMEQAKYDYFFLLNPDTFFTDCSLKFMLNAMQNNPKWGIIGPMIKYENGNIQESALHFPNIRYEVYAIFNILGIVVRSSKKLRRKFFGNKEYKTDFLFGSCLLIRKELNNMLKGFDEDYFLFTEETDYCYRTKHQTGFKTIYFPKSQINHIGGAVTKKQPLKRHYQGYNSKLIFIIKNYSGIYSILLRYTIIILHLQKLVIKYLLSRKEYLSIKKKYLKIIRIYVKKRPEINDIQ